MNIILIGMPGAGKSTVGIVAAKLLNLNFIDTDLLIQQKEQMLLWQILEKKGTDYFFRTEEEVLCSLDPQNTLVATGGSAVYSEKAMKHLGEKGRIIFIDPPLEELTKRVGSLVSRGVASKGAASLPEIYRERLPLYQKYADSTLCPAGQELKETAKQLADMALRRREEHV